ncbi:GNAT family protein [Sinomonas sp. JGH33]|uniref:GNAT family protein n=1 Tax=Sinomonas terricola TaxID=3110330 RepID=A0ABU5T936_9MICC|nr:GNAT family protein [Sinomonas sp. JGH33]MEA5456214.1 GNAT family protein [Sinomonas sp. JGH33]
MMSLDDIWPVLGLRLLTPALELRPLRDDDIPHYIEAARGGLTDPALAPAGHSALANAWDESPQLAENSARWIWESRLRAHPEAWTIMFGIWSHDGEFLGCQDIGAKDFPLLRTVATGSWLRHSARGRGLGAQMRAAVLLWAFDHLGAEVAETSAYDWNEPSKRVSRSLGYVPNGETRVLARPGVVDRGLNFRLAREDFKRPNWELTVEGHKAAAAFLGLANAGAQDDGGRETTAGGGA